MPWLQRTGSAGLADPWVCAVGPASGCGRLGVRRRRSEQSVASFFRCSCGGSTFGGAGGGGAMTALPVGVIIGGRNPVEGVSAGSAEPLPAVPRTIPFGWRRGGRGRGFFFDPWLNFRFGLRLRRGLVLPVPCRCGGSITGTRPALSYLFLGRCCGLLPFAVTGSSNTPSFLRSAICETVFYGVGM
jgi:hypothetical protein